MPVYLSSMGPNHFDMVYRDAMLSQMFGEKRVDITVGFQPFLIFPSASIPVLPPLHIPLRVHFLYTHIYSKFKSLV